MNESTPLSDFLVSQIRTYVPSGVGALISWLALRGFTVSDDQRLAAVTFGTAAITGLYYTAASAAQRKWPLVGRFLLGSKKAPSYSSNQGGGAGSIAENDNPTGDAL